MNTKVITSLIALIVLLGAGYLLIGNKSKNALAPAQPTTQSTVQPTPTQEMETSPSSAMKATDEAMMKKETQVILTIDGFMPQTITIKTGTKVVWTNKSGVVATVHSAPHPTHTSYPPLNLGQMESGTSVSLIFDKPGTYKYHNHLNPSQTGTVVIE